MTLCSDYCPLLYAQGFGRITTGIIYQADREKVIVDNQKVIDACLECPEKKCLMDKNNPNTY